MGHGRASTHRVRIGGTARRHALAYEVRRPAGQRGLPGDGHVRHRQPAQLRHRRLRHRHGAASQGTSVVTNTTPTVAFRGAGRPEAACDIERAVDRFAAAVGIDPVEVRLNNVVPADAFPYTHAIGSTYDSGDYAEALRRAPTPPATTRCGPSRPSAAAAGDPVQLGIGVSCTVEITGGGEGETATVAVRRRRPRHGDRRHLAPRPGPRDHLRRHRGARARRRRRPACEVLHSDTDLSPFGGGTIGSRSAQLGGSAAFGAAVRAVAIGPPEGGRTARGRRRPTSCSTGAGVSTWPARRPGRSVGPTSAPSTSSHKFKPEGGAGTFAFGACVAVVEVDTETGEVRVPPLMSVDDAGTLLHPHARRGSGAWRPRLAVAAALYEEIIYGDDGVPRTATFADYTLISAAELAELRVTIEMETPSPWNPLGVKGVGESGTVVATPALQSAVLDALAPYGIEHLDLPLTPERVWQALASAPPSSTTNPTADQPNCRPTRFLGELTAHAANSPKNDGVS